ncbi:MAG: sigma 54-interacting transcriptional regulator [Planctomycetaceae bacterium]|nr:sigma 54-interacting transcriptional regulator [Planctomycetaceae bacterium]
MQRASEHFYHVLIAQADSRRAGVILKVLAERNLRGTVVTSYSTLRSMFQLHPWKLVFLDCGFCCPQGTGDGFAVVETLHADRPELPIIMLSSDDSAAKALKAIRGGCVDFIARTIDSQVLNRLIDQYIPNHPIEIAAGPHTDSHLSGPIVGRSRELQQLIRMAAAVAPTSAPVMICGPSGSGKELAAQLIHSRSKRAQGPFVRVNCAALSESLLESELFGHEKGAFTGALMQHQGRLERAHGGTLMLDEITETPPAFQAKLLRAIEQMYFERVGGSRQIQVNVRVISTTNKDIVKLVQQGGFRADLYYRLASVRLHVPALAERMEDLGDLTWWFINEYAHEAGRSITGISRQTLEIFQAYSWPGNIRQLRNIIRTILILTTGPVLSITELPWLLDEMRALTMPKEEAGGAGEIPLAELERRAILAALDRWEGNQTRAAQVLGISDRTLREKVKKYRKLECIGAGTLE